MKFKMKEKKKKEDKNLRKFKKISKKQCSIILSCIATEKVINLYINMLDFIVTRLCIITTFFSDSKPKTTDVFLKLNFNLYVGVRSVRRDNMLS